MHRTEGLYNSSNLFTNGPPGTRVEQNWLNAIQEEICYVIEQASVTLLTADTDTRQQLKSALDNLYTRLPSGTVMLFGQNLAPTGWTRKTNWANNAMLCYAATGELGNGGTANPQSAHSHTGPNHRHTGPSHTHTTSSHALTENEMPAHTHFVANNHEKNTTISASYPIGYIGDYDDGRSYTLGSYTAGDANVGLSSEEGGGASHSHGNTGYSGTGNTGYGGTGNTGNNTAPAYQEVMAATKD